MGSECTLDLYADDLKVACSVEAEVNRIESRYSRYRTDSVLSQINQVALTGGSLEVDDETAALLNYAFACYHKSDGLFDITTGILRRAWDFSSGYAPSLSEIDQWLSLVGLNKVQWEQPRLSFPIPGIELDFGGIGKEYAADRAANLCTAAGLKHGLINLGGDIRVIGPRADGTPWPVYIRDPQQPEQFVSLLQLTTGGLATSGDYERFITINGQRYGHILNPHTGWPTKGLASVTVLMESCLVAGSVSTIAMLKGIDGINWLTELSVPCFWIDEKGREGSHGIDQIKRE